MAYWFGFAAIASAVGGLIAFGIQHVHSDIGNWRLLFIIEVPVQYIMSVDPVFNVVHPRASLRLLWDLWRILSFLTVLK